MKEIKAHKFAELFPFMPAMEMNELVNDIRANGLLSPIILFEGKILDGRHRYEACLIAEVKPKFEQYKGDDPLGFVLSSNLKRRHLDTSQRAMVAARLANMPQGRPEIKPANLPVAQSKAAETLVVSERSLRTAKTIIDESPRLTKLVDSGEISLNAAAKQIAEKEKASEPVVDETGYPIPADLHKLWARRNEVRQMLSDITNISTRLLSAQKAEDKLFEVVHVSTVVSDLQHAHMEVKAAQLYAVCTSCQGRMPKRCAFCKGRGLITEQAYKLVPSEIRAIREKAKRK